MTPDGLKNRKLAALFLLGWALYNYPVLSLFNLPASLFGIPLLFAYGFIAWAVIIGLVVLATRFTRQA